MPSRNHNLWRLSWESKDKNVEVRLKLSEDPNRSVFSVILEQNRRDKELLMRLMTIGRPIKRSEFLQQALERLQCEWQWGMSSYNIRDPAFLCKHGCSYCYVGPLFARFKRQCQRVDIEDPMPVSSKSVTKSWSRVSNPNRQVYFFPSTSDIFEENANDYVRVCRKIIDAGHEIMFVSGTMPADYGHC